MKIKSSRRLVKRLGLALAVAAVFAPNAQAIPLDMSARSTDSVQSRQYADDLRVGPVVRQYADDRVVGQVGGHEGYMPINTLAQPVVSSSDEASTGIDWSNATIGIGTLFALLGFGAMLIVVRHSRRGRLAAA